MTSTISGANAHDTGNHVAVAKTGTAQHRAEKIDGKLILFSIAQMHLHQARDGPARAGTGQGDI